jgi:hypothetical protein
MTRYDAADAPSFVATIGYVRSLKIGKLCAWCRGKGEGGWPCHHMMEQEMSSKNINLSYGDRVTISGDNGLSLRVDNGEGGSAVHVTPDQARAIARTLDAFAEIHTREVR